MNDLEAAFTAGMMLAFFTWGVCKIVLMEFREEREQKKTL
ncbi:Hypothetical protein TFLO_1029 [Trichococcus flocculiformis]|uniref:Uncharacterized protein n=1 Tax=Trichococcus flocculiformis TaxID=82803 RepID=A0AB38BHR4_9LACT|nr:Hypothetical protein TFLO_1029 [Trichococcus flocculiformis]SFH77501.1 hypothetical protein SAMN04488507_101439 [Trichococcus flocculiformis]